MGKFMYPIVIKREPQQIKYTREIVLNSDVFTLAKLGKLISESEYFTADIQESREGYEIIVLNVYGERLETQDELDVRVAKQEKYMENYHKFHGTEPK